MKLVIMEPLGVVPTLVDELSAPLKKPVTR